MCPAWKDNVPICGTGADNLRPMSASPANPEGLRAALAAYVHAVHGAYLEVANGLPPAEQGRLPLFTVGGFTVAAVGTANLHLIATAEHLPPPTGVEVVLPDELGGMQWDLRFYDPSIIPALASIDETAGPDLAAVRRALGLSTYLYHFTVPPGSDLTAHHAMHAGVGLAHAHAAAESQFRTMRELAAGRERLVDEFHGAFIAGLPTAQALLAAQLAPQCATVRAISDSASSEAGTQPGAIDTEALRKAVIADLRGGGG